MEIRIHGAAGPVARFRYASFRRFGLAIICPILEPDRLVASLAGEDLRRCFPSLSLACDVSGFIVWGVWGGPPATLLAPLCGVDTSSAGTCPTLFLPPLYIAYRRRDEVFNLGLPSGQELGPGSSVERSNQMLHVRATRNLEPVENLPDPTCCLGGMSVESVQTNEIGRCASKRSHSK